MILTALRSSRRFRFAALLALWAMLLPALLPLVHPPAALAGMAKSICHVALGGDHNQTPAQDKARSSCPICQGLSSLAQGFVPPEIVALVPFQLASVAAYGRDQAFVFSETLTTAWPRAPPVLA